MKIGEALSATQLIIEWYGFIQEEYPNAKRVGLNANSKQSDADEQVVMDAIYQDRHPDFPELCKGWLASTIGQTAFAHPALSTSRPQPYTTPPITSLLQTLNQNLNPDIQHVLIPVALDFPGVMYDTNHWVLMLYHSNAKKITILDSKGESYFEMLLKWATPSLAQWLYPSAYPVEPNPDTLNPQKIETIKYGLQSLLNNTDCGQYTVACAKVLSDENMDIHALLNNLDKVQKIIDEAQRATQASQPAILTGFSHAQEQASKTTAEDESGISFEVVDSCTQKNAP